MENIEKSTQNNSKPSVYLCGPIQFAADRGKGWRNRVKRRDECDWLDPFDKYDNTTDEGAEWSDEAIVENDLNMINNSDALLVHWEEVPTAGTPMEIRYAYEHGLPIVMQTTIPLDRLSPWITYHTDTVSRSFDHAISAILFRTEDG